MILMLIPANAEGRYIHFVSESGALLSICDVDIKAEGGV